MVFLSSFRQILWLARDCATTKHYHKTVSENFFATFEVIAMVAVRINNSMQQSQS